MYFVVLTTACFFYVPSDSCAGRCGAGVDPGQTCQCNSLCSTYGDCCSDYYALCTQRKYCLNQIHDSHR